MSALNPKQGFTCVACRLVFPNAHLQKEHYVSEWHRYNAKRQVAGLPAISEEQFVAKVQDFQKASEDLKKKGETEKAYCKYCKKLFQSQNAHDNHLNSKRHKTNEASYVEEEPVKSEKVSSEEQNDVKEGTATKFVDGEASTESEEGWESTESDDDTELDDNKVRFIFISNFDFRLCLTPLACSALLFLRQPNRILDTWKPTASLYPMLISVLTFLVC